MTPRRWLLVVLVALACVAATGWPQRKLLEFAIGAVVGADVRIEGLRLFERGTGGARQATLSRLAAVSARDVGKPLADIKYVVVAYSLFPKDGRFIDKLQVESADISLPSVPLSTSTRRSPRAPSMRFMPREVELNVVNVACGEQGGAALSGNANIDDNELRLEIRDASFQGLTSTNLPVRGDGFDLKGTLRVKYGDSFAIPEINLRLLAKNIAVGPVGAELYQGDLAVSGAGSSEDPAGMAFDVMLNRGQRLHVTAKSDASTSCVTATIENWLKDDVYAVAPKSQRWLLSFLQGVCKVNSAQVSLTKNGNQLAVAADMRPELAIKGAENAARVTFESTGDMGSGPRFALSRAKLKLEAAGGSIEYAGGVDLAAQALNGTVTLQGVDPAPWSAIALGKPRVESISGGITGTIDLTTEPGFAKMSGTARISMVKAPFSYLLNEGEKLEAAGGFAIERKPEWTLTSPEFSLKIAQGNSVSIQNLKMDLFSYDTKAEIHVETDLDRLPWFLGGHARLDGPLRHENGITIVPIEAEVTEMTAPWLKSLPLANATATITYDNLKGAGSISGLRFASDQTIVLQTADGTFEALPFTVETDLQPLVAMGLFASASGNAKLTGTAGYGQEGVYAQWAFTADIAEAAFAGASATIEGGVCKGKIRYGPGTTGAGEYSARRLVAGVAALSDVGGTFEMVDGNLVTRGATASFAKGILRGDFDIGISDADMPITGDVRVADLDLAAVTDVLPYPWARMTGIASGMVTIAASGKSISDLELTLESSRDFSMSAELLEWLLAGQFAQQSGGKVDKAVVKILGKEEMPAFDSAKLTLRYGGDRIFGQAVLKSHRLDLSVDLALDWAAVSEFLQIVREHGGIA